MGSDNRTGLQQLMSVSCCSLLEIAEQRLFVCCVESVGGYGYDPSHQEVVVVCCYSS